MDTMKTQNNKKAKENSSNNYESLLEEEAYFRENNNDEIVSIVGIGGGEGAEESYEKFFAHMPQNSGMAFVLIHHFDSGYTQRLMEQIAKCALMKVLQIEDEVEVESNCVYIAPFDKYVSISKGFLKLISPAAPFNVQMPLDFFLKNLGRNLKEKSACIIFSGSGTDGVLGLKEIKKNFGLVMVQDPLSSSCRSMPLSAIDTGLADYVAFPEALPSILYHYIKSTTEGSKEKYNEIQREPLLLEKICVLLKDKTGHDFSMYKKSTIYRRIERRMKIFQLERLSDYIDFLIGNHQELELLFKELLIGVTNFFRDEKIFHVLKEKILPEWLESKLDEYCLRIWIPGCSTGEEVYSIAILLQECLRGLTIKKPYKILIFATDINESAINFARRGIYPSNISEEVSPQRLEQFFNKIDNNHYQVKNFIRENVVFALQNIILDPPFIKLDMLCCRNLLIYFLPELQKHLISMFHYCLKPGGILFLGSSESIGDFTNLFSPSDNRSKIFRRIESIKPYPYYISESSAPLSLRNSTLVQETTPMEDAFQYAGQKILLERYAPVSVLINLKGDIIYFNGHTDKYLEPPQGKANINIFAMAREGLKPSLDRAIDQLLITGKEVTIYDVKVNAVHECYRINLIIKPLSEFEALKGLAMVIFEEIGPVGHLDSNGKSTHQTENGLDSVITEDHVDYLKEQLKNTVSEMVASQETSRLVMEELQSANEELQSTNEELTTSKEEMQSLNEELMSVNAELLMKNEALIRTDDDVRNLLNSTDIAILILDEKFVVKRFTNKIKHIFNLILSDVGRLITDITMNIKYDALTEDINSVLKTSVKKEIQLQGKDQLWYLVSILPYKTSSNAVNGVIITFTDISLIKKLEIEKEASRDFAESITVAMREALLVLDADLTIVTANPSFYNLFEVSPEEIKNQHIYRLGEGQWDKKELRDLLEDILNNNTCFNDYLVEYSFPEIGSKRMLLNGRKLNLKSQKTEWILLVIQDITHFSNDCIGSKE
jgi:two-component system, chemotaxis family, CheB/CheR fusion protein